MKRAWLLGLLVGCSSPSAVSIHPDPITDAPTAYATLFLDTTSRLVLAAPVGGESVAVTLWMAVVGDRGCNFVLTAGGNLIEVGPTESRRVDTPSGTDLVVSTTIPAASLAAFEAPASVSCGAVWTLDDVARETVVELVERSRG